MPNRLPVAILGFGAFERQALLSALRTSSVHAATYRVVDASDEARLVIVDTDDVTALQRLRQQGQLPQTVCIGASAPDAAGAWMMRPVDAAKALKLLDVVASRVGLSADAGSVTREGSTQAAAAPGPTASASSPTSATPAAERRRAGDAPARAGDRRT